MWGGDDGQGPLIAGPADNAALMGAGVWNVSDGNVYDAYRMRTHCSHPAHGTCHHVAHFRQSVQVDTLPRLSLSHRANYGIRR
jgi:hypothetical protein